MVTGIKGFVARQTTEITDDPALRAYGGVLAALHVTVYLVWLQFPMASILGRGQLAICWPFFENCARYRFLNSEGVATTLLIYLVLAVLTICLFARRRIETAAYGALLSLNALAVAIVVQDFRLRSNEHYMLFVVSFIFLFLPNKRRLLQYQIAAFYFFAGTLKLDREWLSGAALYAMPLGVSPAYVPVACTYVVVLELVLVWGLFARRAMVFWATLAQLVLFHITSFTVVGFFYPLLMFGILSIFPMARLQPMSPPPQLDRLFTGREPLATNAVLGLFALMQVAPRFFPGDSAITGEGRIFALHMFDARVVCDASAVLHQPNGQTRSIPVNQPLAVRIRCDPIVYLSVGRDVCRRYCREAGLCTDIDLNLSSRRSTESELRPVLALANFCQQNVHYSLWRPNPWILR